MALNEMLPRFGIPMRAPDADVPLDLQRVFNRCYDEGAYDDLIDYAQPPGVALTEAERLFVAGRATSQR